MHIIQNIKQYLLSNNLDAYIIHMYNRCDNKVSDISDIEAMCGFTGSAGTCIITKDKNILCVDGRYEKQAVEQVDMTEWDVVCGDYISVLGGMAQKKSDIMLAIPGDVVTYATYKRLSELATTTTCQSDFFDHLYLPNRRKLVRSHFYHEHKDRLKRFRDFIQDNYSVICDPSLIAWLFCLRMDELQDFTPIPRVIAYVTNDKAIVFCDLEPGDEFDYDVLPFEDMANKIPSSRPVLADASHTPCGLWRENFVDERFHHFESVKSPDEIRGMRLAAQHASEAFERTIAQINICETEQDVADLLYKEMSKCPDFIGFSFDPIVASGTNSSIIHYTERKSRIQDGILLIDVGGQYKYGTTDMTRTIWIGDGEPPEEVKLHYQAVKRSVEMFTRAKFPVGTTISSLDAFARYHIWQVGMDYKFGTGHGVGCYANVHEYPSVSQRSKHSVLEPGNIVTVEPGIYTDSYGIRLEDMLLIVDLGNGFLGFETLGGLGLDVGGGVFLYR